MTFLSRVGVSFFPFFTATFTFFLRFEVVVGAADIHLQGPEPMHYHAVQTEVLERYIGIAALRREVEADLTRPLRRSYSNVSTRITIFVAST